MYNQNLPPVKENTVIWFFSDVVSDMTNIPFELIRNQIVHFFRNEHDETNNNRPFDLVEIDYELNEANDEVIEAYYIFSNSLRTFVPRNLIVNFDR
jgi:hypothetical protein